MNLIAASLGIIIGTLCFSLAGFKLFIASLVVMAFSTLAFTSFAKYQKAILLCFTCFLLSYFNYHLRADYLEVQNLDSQLKSGNYELEIISKPRSNPYYESEFILELKNPKKLELARIFLPYRVLAKSSSSKGFELGDVLELDSSKTIMDTVPLSQFKTKVLRKDKVYRALKNKNLVYVKHKSNPIEWLQKSIQRVYEGQMSYENSQIVTSLILGSRVAKLPDEFNSQIRNLGLSHIFAASGFNLLIISASLAWLFKRLRLKQELAAIVSIVASVIYTALAGFSPSIVRACIFVVCFMALKFLGRKPLSMRFLVIVAALILAIDPYTIFDIGFQLSYLATLALIIFASPIQERLSSLSFMKIVPKYFQEIISSSLAVQLLLMPLIIYYFQSAQIWALAANIIFTPLVTVIVLLAVVGLGFILEPLLNLFRYLLELSEHLPWIELRLELDFLSYSLLTLICVYIAFLIAAPSDSRPPILEFLSKKYIRTSLISSLLLFLLAGTMPPPGLETIELYHGEFRGKYSKAINEFIFDKNSPNYKYLEIAGLKSLIIKGKRNIKTLGALEHDLEEVQLLILPKLNSADMYLDTLLDLTRPQFVICNISKSSARAKKNAEIIASRSNMLLNSAKLYVSRKRFWSIGANE